MSAKCFLGPILFNFPNNPVDPNNMHLHHLFCIYSEPVTALCAGSTTISEADKNFFFWERLEVLDKQMQIIIYKMDKQHVLLHSTENYIHILW